MMLDRRRFVTGSIGAAWWLAGNVAPAVEKPQLHAALSRGIEWLLKQQAEDGGWHSETYGALRQGSATTAMAIYALSHTQRDLVDLKVQNALARGLKFLGPGIKKRGFVAAPDGSLDYPTYGTAMLATAAYQRDFGLKDEHREKFVDWVASGQLHESREFTEKSPHYGGWDLMGASQVKGLTSDTNVSCSCYALEAVRHGWSNSGPAIRREREAVLERALQWVHRCQDLRGDGGFWFSPDTHSINHKAGWHDKQQTKPKTYASATADGLRCLNAAMLTVSKEEPHLVAAEKHLIHHTDIEAVPGFEDPKDPNSWAMGLRFYYYQSLAKAMDCSKSWTIQRRTAIIKHLIKLQTKDGRWQNESARMREDDPLIATCLALTALAVLEPRDRAEPMMP